MHSSKILAILCDCLATVTEDIHFLKIHTLLLLFFGGESINPIIIVVVIRLHILCCVDACKIFRVIRTRTFRISKEAMMDVTQAGHFYSWPPF